MALDMTLTVTNGGDIEIPDEIVETLVEAWEALRKLPSDRQLNINFDTTQEAKLFVRQGKTWAAQQTVILPEKVDDDGNVVPARETALAFERKGDIKGNPNRVTFRIHPRRELTEEQKAQRAATRAANRQAVIDALQDNAS